jgi:hypothetical protein
MAAKVKIYDTHESRPGTAPHIVDLLGGLNHNQVAAYTMNTSKVAAAARMLEAGVYVYRPGALRLHDVGTVQVFVAAGLFGPDTVLVTPLVRDDAVVSVDADNNAIVAGRFGYEPAVRDRVFRTIDGRGFRYITGTGEVIPVP